MNIAEVSYREVSAFLNSLTEDELRALANNVSAVRDLARNLIAKAPEFSFVQFLSDEEAIKWLITYKKYTQPAAKALVAKWRKLGADLGWTGPVAWRVRDGFTLKQHAPNAGPCYKRFEYLQEWKSFADEPTKSAFVFWIPVIISGTRDQNKDEQLVVLANVRRIYDLPMHHLSGFGDAALLTALILAEFKRSGKRILQNNDWIRTATWQCAGSLINLGDFGEDGLCCIGCWDGSRGSSLGAFAFGVELED